MSLTGCIRKAGKALNRDDAAAIKENYTELTQGGMPGEEAATRAVEHYLAELKEEKSGLIAEAESRGGDVSKYVSKSVLLAAVDRTKELARGISVSKHIDAGKKMPGLPKDVNTRSFAKYLSARVRKLNRGKLLNATTPRNKEIISEVLAQETEAAMNRSGHAGNWYSDTLGDAMSIAAVLHPELETDANARNAFLVGMAITSNGMTVAENTKYAEQVYSYFKKHGKFQIWGVGAESGAMKKGFQLYNSMASKWGNATLNEFLHTQFTVGELELLGFNISGENKETTVYGSAVFGPKVGGAFFQNLSGNYTPLTMDRWWMRTWGRIVGNLAPDGKGEAQAARLRELLPQDSDLQTNDKKLAAFALKTHREYARGGFKDKSDLNKAAKNYDNALNDPNVAPRSGGERAWIREVTADALTKLKDRGMELNTASMQALLWYPEKEFYLINGVGNERSKPTDYSIEFGKLAESRGIDKSRVAAARSSAVSGRAARDVEPSREAGVEVQRGPGLARQARQQLVHIAAARKIANLDKGAYAARVPTGTQRFIEGAPVAQTHKPNIITKNTLERAGLPAPTFLELANTPKGAALFRDSLRSAVAAGKKKAPVRIFAEEEYENMHTYLTPDGLSGFALNGEELVSVFKHPKSDMNGVAQPMVRLAVEQGARRLGVYDTAVPYVYSMQGFKAVSRTATDAGPDLVFMVWDRTSEEMYSPTDGERFTTVAGALAKSIEESANLMTRNAPTSSILLRLGDEVPPIADNAPDNPLSQLTKMAATMEDQAKNGPNGARGIKASLGDLALGKNASNVERVLGAIPRRNIQDFVSNQAMPSAKRYIQTANRMEGRRNELLIEQEKVGKRWNKYVGGNKEQARTLGELMHAATLAGVDPSAPYKALVKDPRKMNMDQRRVDAKRRGDHRILKKWWDGMDQEGQDIFIEVRNAYLKQRTAVWAALEARINATPADAKAKGALMLKLRKQFESGRVAGPYFPLARFGDLWASAKNDKGESVAFARFEKVSEQREWMKNMREDGFKVDGGKKMDDRAIVDQIDPGFASRVTEMAKNVDPALADEIWQMYLKSLPELSMRKGFMHRKGRLGFTADAVRSFGHNMFHGSHQLAKLEYMHQLEGDLLGMKAEARRMEQKNDPEALWGNAVFREMARRHEWAKNPMSSAWATKLTGLGFAWYLGLTPAAAAVNMSQTAIVGLPVLSAKFGWTKSAAELIRSAGLYASSWGPLANRLRGDERLAFEEAERIGMFDKTQSHDLAGVAEQGMDYTSKGHIAMTIISWMFHKMEEFNRQVTFLSGYRLARDQGMTHNDAIMLSEDLTWDSHFDYNSVNRPRYMQGDVARVLLLFRQYSMNMTYRLARDFNDSVRSVDPVVKKEARTRFSGMMGMTGLFAGATGLPMFWAVEAVMNAMMGDEDEPYDFVDDTRSQLAEITSPEIADIITKGPVDYLSGATMSSRVSLNNLWAREAPAHLEGVDLFAHYLGEIAGPIPSIAKDAFFKAPQELKEGNFDRALESVLPKSLKDAAKMYRYFNEGVQNRRGDVIIPQEEITSKDLFLQASGFTPARITKQHEQNRAVKNAERHILNRRSWLTDHLFLAYREQDKREIKAVMDKILRFNKTNPSMRIDSGSIISSAKSRARYSQGAVGGVTLNKNLRYLHQKYRFGNRGE